MRGSKRLLSALCCLVLFGGCAPYTIKSQPQTRQQAERFVVLDRDVRSKLVLVSAQLEAAPDGRLTFTCTIRNKKDKGLWRPGFLWDLVKGVGSLFVRKSSAQEGPEWADLKVQWLDAQGAVVEETNWQPVQFHRLMDKSLTYHATGSGVSDCRVYIRTREHIR